MFAVVGTYALSTAVFSPKRSTEIKVPVNWLELCFQLAAVEVSSWCEQISNNFPWICILAKKNL